MSNNESYELHPGDALEKAIEACHWRRVRGGEPRLWELCQSRILVDHIGIFIYRKIGGSWVRIAGLSHNHIRHLPDRLIKFNDFTMDLMTGQ